MQAPNCSSILRFVTFHLYFFFSIFVGIFYRVLLFIFYFQTAARKCFVGSIQSREKIVNKKEKSTRKKKENIYVYIYKYIEIYICMWNVQIVYVIIKIVLFSLQFAFSCRLSLRLLSLCFFYLIIVFFANI